MRYSFKFIGFFHLSHFFLFIFKEYLRYDRSKAYFFNFSYLHQKHLLITFTFVSIAGSKLRWKTQKVKFKFSIRILYNASYFFGQHAKYLYWFSQYPPLFWIYIVWNQKMCLIWTMFHICMFNLFLHPFSCNDASIFY